MADRDRDLRDEIQARLLALSGRLPTSRLGRLGRTALAALRGGRVARLGHGDPVPRVDELAAFVSSLGQLKGMAMKAGQLLSYLDLPLPGDVRSALAALQTHSPPMAFDEVAEILAQELGGMASVLLARMERTPLAAASIGQVHRTTLADGVAVAVKVQVPGVERAIAADFRSAAVASSFVGVIVPGASVEAVVREARRAVLDECDYEREASCQERMARLYEAHAVLTVPEVVRPFCSRRILTTRFARGSSFDAFLASNPPQVDRDRLGEALFEFYLGSLFRHGLFNWDPHPGNYIVQPDGRIAMLDHGSTRELDRTFVRKLAALALAVHADERRALERALLGLGMISPGESRQLETARDLVRAFHGPMLRDEVLSFQLGTLAPFRSIVSTKREILSLHIPGEMLFVLRIRFGLMSVLARLGARANWCKLERQYAADAVARDGG
ncbi:MAG TPA: AarF/ABC1/UbiB kinase family protein [Anaeromyxobacteraceae bacterium]|nr:AarF/ABC1/UbiB kinase family protein [Anaeromyxobacteraceae bacterium]